MKLTKQNINDLQVIINHTRLDLDYGLSGSYIDQDGNIFKPSRKAAVRAIKLLQKIMSNDIKN
jgi:hypothetical protein